MKICKLFERAVSVICILLFFFIGGCALYNLTKTGAFSPKQPVLQVVYGLFFCALIILIILTVFRCIDRASAGAQAVITWAMFAFMAAVFLILFLKFDVRPITDSFDDIDVAWYLTDHSHVGPDNAYSHIMGIYGNNYLFIILLSFFFRLLRHLGVSQVTTLLNILYIINITGLLLGTSFTWLSVKEVAGIKSANKTLLLCALNPVYYGLAFWFYSCTLSVPIMMLIIYTAIRIYKAKTLLSQTLLCIAEGILTVLGFEIRPTAVFPVIAMAICVIGLLIKRKELKRILLSGAVILAVSVCTFMAAGSLKNSRFSEMMPNNYPVSYWLLLGSYGNGDLTGQDFANQSADSFDSEERFAGCLKLALECYKEKGPAETVKLWLKKTKTTWADGYSGINERLESGETESELFEYIAGERKGIYEVYSLAFRIATMLGMLLFCIGFFRGRSAPAEKDGREMPQQLCFMLLLTVFGGMVFYMLWEAKNVYSAPFICVMLMLAADGWSEPASKLPYTPLYKHMRIALPAALAVTCILTAVSVKATVPSEYHRISALYNTRKNRHIECGNDDIVQSFEVKKPFNRIALKADCEETDISDYEITITDSGGNTVMRNMIYPKDIHEGHITLDFDTISDGRPYVIAIQKKNPERGNICFYTKISYLLDSYKGTLYTEGHGAYIADLMMDVMYIAR